MKIHDSRVHSVDTVHPIWSKKNRAKAADLKALTPNYFAAYLVRRPNQINSELININTQIPTRAICIYIQS